MPSIDRSTVLIDKQQADLFRCDSFNAGPTWVVACRGLTFSFSNLKSMISLLNFCSLEFKFVVIKKNLKWGCHCRKINSFGYIHE